MQTQIIYTGNDYEIARHAERAERPEWPVQDAGGHWHHEQFDGQLAVFRGAQVFFGFMAEEVVENEVPRHADGEMNFDGLFLCNDGCIYRDV